jgi:hypothetical protein
LNWLVLAQKVARTARRPAPIRPTTLIDVCMAPLPRGFDELVAVADAYVLAAVGLTDETLAKVVG